MADYVSSHTGEEIDEAVETAKTAAKQADLASLAVRVTTLENQANKQSIDETVYAAIRSNVNTLRERINALINAMGGMANYAFVNGRPTITEIGEMSWPSGGTTNPLLISPSGPIDFGTLAASAQSITKSVYIKGLNLTKPLTLAITQNSSFSLFPSPVTISAANANAGTNVNIVYQRTDAQQSYSATGILSITSEENVGGNFNLSVFVDVDQGGDTPDPGGDDYVELYNVTGKPLLLHLDGLSQGGEEGVWIDKTHGLRFALNGNADASSENKGVYFGNEGDYGVCTNTNYVVGSQTFDLLDLINSGECTIEVCFHVDSSFGASGYFNPLFVTRAARDNNDPDKIACIYGHGGYDHFDFRTHNSTVGSDVSWIVESTEFSPNTTTLYRVSMNKNHLVVNGSKIGTKNERGIAPAPSIDNYLLMVGGRVGTSSTRVSHATIHEVRIYQGLLTETEMQTNQQTDNRSDRYGTGIG